MQELRKCPFCGGKAVFKINSNSSSCKGVEFIFEIKCENCGAQLPKLYKVEISLEGDGRVNAIYDDRKRAIEEWNERA